MKSIRVKKNSADVFKYCEFEYKRKTLLNTEAINQCLIWKYYFIGMEIGVRRKQNTKLQKLERVPCSIFLIGTVNNRSFWITISDHFQILMAFHFSYSLSYSRRQLKKLFLQQTHIIFKT